jgi:hypothetical protein
MMNKFKPKHWMRVALGIMLCLSAGLVTGQEDLLNAYKSGPLLLEADPEFGKKSDWNSLFYHLFCDITAAPDGSIFIASSRQHKIFKFDPTGTLIKSFGRKGQGPGDFNTPGDLSVLDGKLLVVGEYALSHRISLFDLEGNFQKLIKTRRPPYRPIALRDGKIAYVVFSYRGEGQANTKRIASVVIRDINSDQEIQVAEFTFNTASLRIGQMSYSFGGGTTSGEAFIASSNEGNLIVGNSLRPFLEVFSPEGSKISTIPLNMEPIPVTKQLIREYKKYHIDRMSGDSDSAQDQNQERQKQFRKASWDHMFAENLPLYREFLVDAEGNLIVFRATGCWEDCPKLIQVYSSEGEFICDTELIEGPFALTIDPRIRNMCFTRQGLIAMVEVKDAEEFELRLIKVAHK